MIGKEPCRITKGPFPIQENPAPSKEPQGAPHNHKGLLRAIK